MNSRASTRTSSSSSRASPASATRPAGIGTNQFEDFADRLDRHFHREEHQLLPLAHEVLCPDDLQDVQHAFAKAKIKALRKQHRKWGLSSGVLVGALAAAAAGALGFTAWRSG